MWIEVLGWLGVAAIIGAYAMVAVQRWKVRSVENQILNVIGSALLAVNSVVHAAWVPTALNGIWMIVAGWTLFSLRRPAS